MQTRLKRGAPLTGPDISVIKSWPPYPAEFSGLDYALRDRGWLDEYDGKPGTELFVARDNNRCPLFAYHMRKSAVVSQPAGGRCRENNKNRILINRTPDDFENSHAITDDYSTQKGIKDQKSCQCHKNERNIK